MPARHYGPHASHSLSTARCLVEGTAASDCDGGGSPKKSRDPDIIHLNLALSLLVSPYFGAGKATCFKNGDLLRGPVQTSWELEAGGHHWALVATCSSGCKMEIS